MSRPASRVGRAPITTSDALAYGIAHFGKSLIWTSADMLMIFVMVVVQQLPAADAGAIFMVSLMWNAACDVIIGRWLDRQVERNRWRGMFLPLAGLATALAFGLSLVSGFWGVWPAAVAAFLFRTVYALYDVPHNALISSMASGPNEMIKLSRARTYGSNVAALVGAIAATPALSGARDMDNGLIGFAVIIVVISALCMLAIGGLGMQLQKNAASAGRASAWPKWNATIFAWLAAAGIGGVAVGIFGRALLHLPHGQTPGWTEFHFTDSATILLIFIVGKLGSAIVMPFTARSFGRMSALSSAYLLLALLCAALPLALTRLPESLPAIALLAGACVGGINLINWAILPELALVLGKDSNGRLFGMFTCISKVALGLSGWCAAWLIGNDGALVRTDAVWLAILVGGLATIAVSVLRRTPLAD